MGIYFGINMDNWLVDVGGIPTPLKNDGVNVSWDDEIPNIWKIIIQLCSKPPTR